jgi:hypothetical protein
MQWASGIGIELTRGRAMIQNNYFQDWLDPETRGATTVPAVFACSSVDGLIVTGNQLTGHALSLNNTLSLEANNQP